uniref:Putative lysozyme-like protein isoform x2 n=1 Tax=Lutzomyia longipalpis TaxID=7200 RepID=A0A1B0GKJ3_LUTLO
MKPLLCGLFLATLATFTFANYGHYIPKAAFTVNEDGQILSYLPLHPATMSRFKRSAQISSSSSSASASTSSGNSPIYFGNPYGGAGFPPSFGAPFGHQQTFVPPRNTYTGSSSTSSISTGPSGLHSRFGADEPPPPVRIQGSTSSITSQNGEFTQTQSHLGEDGKVHFTISSGKF